MNYEQRKQKNENGCYGNFLANDRIRKIDFADQHTPHGYCA